MTLSSSFAFAAEEQQKTMTEKEMQDQLKKMEKEIAEMRQTKNPEERTRLMHEHMGHMRGMMTDDMGCGEGGHMMGHEPKQ
jgi:hypothetical protein